MARPALNVPPLAIDTLVLSLICSTPVPALSGDCRVNEPAVNASGPEKLFVPSSDSDPVPCFTRPPLPIIAPLNTLLELLSPSVNVSPLLNDSVPAPEIALKFCQ